VTSFAATLLVGLAGLLLFRHAILLVAAAIDLLTPRQALRSISHTTVIVPAWNEEAAIVETVRSILHSDHPFIQLIVVDDGSTDGTLKALQTLTTDRRLTILRHEENRGKAAALNTGLAKVETRSFVTVDADTLLDRNAITRLIGRTQQGAAAVSANLKVKNRDGALGAMQALEYIAALNLDRRAQATFRCITTVPGACSAFSTQAVRAAGGFSDRTVTEDTDLTIALLSRKQKVQFDPTAVAWTNAPHTWSGLHGQRTRWSTGYLQCLWLWKGQLFRPSRLGWFGLPNLLYAHLITYLLAPLWLVGLFGAFATWSLEPVLWGLAGLIGLDALMAMLSVLVERESPRLLLWAIPFRIVWPMLLMTVFARIVWRRVRRVPTTWLGRTAGKRAGT